MSVLFVCVSHPITHTLSATSVFVPYYTVDSHIVGLTYSTYTLSTVGSHMVSLTYITLYPERRLRTINILSC